MDEQDEIPTAELEQPLLSRPGRGGVEYDTPTAPIPPPPGAILTPHTTEVFGAVLPVPGQEGTVGDEPPGEHTTVEFSALLPTPTAAQRRAPPRPLEPGTKIDRLTLGQLLERTPACETFLASHPRYGACRVSVATPAGTAHANERLLDARLRTTFSHPGLARVLELGSRPRPWVAEEHDEGWTLGALFAAGKAPEPYELAELVLQVALALDEAHRARVVHGDLLPSDVILTKAGPRLRGFGRTTVINPRGERLAFPEGPVVGDGRYAPPERCRSGEQTARGDVYALGALCYEGLMGRPPFQGTSAEVLRGVLDRQPGFSGVAAGSLRAGSLAVAKRALAKGPSQRYATAGAFAEAIRQALNEAQDEAAVRGWGWVLVPCSLLLALAAVAAVAVFLSY